jgi:hypothetical protein
MIFGPITYFALLEVLFEPSLSLNITQALKDASAQGPSNASIKNIQNRGQGHQVGRDQSNATGGKLLHGVFPVQG